MVFKTFLRRLMAISLLGLALQDSNCQMAIDNEKSLEELCQIYKTDKCGHLHNYVEIYQKEFEPIRHRVSKVFEIGILSGASHRMWKAYFEKAEIYGIDIKDCSHLEKEGIHTLIADQSSRTDLSQFVEKHGSNFDIIIDDGGHSMEQQQVSLGYLFKHLKPGGIYVIEDIHTSLTKYYQGFGVNSTGSNSTFNLMVQFMATNHMSSPYLLAEEIAYLRLNIDICELVYITNSMHSMMCIIRKKE
jgi:trans-aconitate methyltransferase